VAIVLRFAAAVALRFGAVLRGGGREVL